MFSNKVIGEAKSTTGISSPPFLSTMAQTGLKFDASGNDGNVFSFNAGTSTATAGGGGGGKRVNHKDLHKRDIAAKRPPPFRSLAARISTSQIASSPVHNTAITSKTGYTDKSFEELRYEDYLKAHSPARVGGVVDGFDVQQQLQELQLQEPTGTWVGGVEFETATTAGVECLHGSDSDVKCDDVKCDNDDSTVIIHTMDVQ